MNSPRREILNEARVANDSKKKKRARLAHLTGDPVYTVDYKTADNQKHTVPIYDLDDAIDLLDEFGWTMKADGELKEFSLTPN